MKKWLNFYFNLSKREFNGLLVLIALIILIKALPFAYSMLKLPPAETIEEKAAVAALLKEIQPQRRYPSRKTWPSPDKKHVPTLFFFDPNRVGMEGWQRLGLSVKQAAALLRYREKGGRFKKKEDLQKMYTISPDKYRMLAPFVRIAPDTATRHGGYLHTAMINQGSGKHQLNVVEINGADSAMLCRIRGVGPSFARRIISYRDRIGGFYHKAQLMEVYGLDSAKFAEISSQILIDRTLLRKIQINSAMPENFKNNPYIRYKQVNALIQYRKQHGNYTNIADLNKVLIVDSATISRIAPYLTF